MKLNRLVFLSFLLTSSLLFGQETDVQWTQLHNAQFTGTLLERSGTKKATAISSNVLFGYGAGAYNDGYIRYVSDQDTRGRHLGFSSFPNIAHKRSELKYSFFFHQPGKVKILEEGVNQGVFNYSLGDEFIIAREKRDIVYIINNVEVRRITVEAREDLFVEAVLIEDGSKLKGVKKNFSTLPFKVVIDVNSTANSIDLTVSGANAPYTFLWSNRETTEDITAVENGSHCVQIEDAYGNMIIRIISINGQVAWTNFDHSQELNGNLEHTTGGNWGGAIGPNPLWAEEDGWIEYTLTNMGSKRAFGLTTASTVREPQDIDFGFYILDDYKFKIIQDGIYLANLSYNEYDVFKLEKRAGRLLYYKNENLIGSYTLTNSVQYNFAGSVKSGAGLLKVRCDKRITPYPVEIDGLISHCTNGNDDGAIDVTIDYGTHLVDSYLWQRVDIGGGVYSVESGSDLSMIDVTGLENGLYILRLQENGSDVDYRYFLVGEEGVVTDAIFHPIYNGRFSEDALIRYDKKTLNGDITDGQATGNTGLTGTSYDARSVIKYKVDFGGDLVFTDARQTFRPKAGHFKTNSSSNDSWLSLVLEDWEEDYVTWNDRPQISTTIRVDNPGTTEKGYTRRFDSLDILNFIEYWQENPDENFGFELGLQSYNQSSGASVDYSSSEYVGHSLMVSFVPEGSVVSSFDEELQIGSILVLAPDGDLPYTYLLSYDPLPELNDIWLALKDSLPIDSTTFFRGDQNSKSFVFEDLEAERYYVAVYDNSGVKIQESKVLLGPDLDLDQSEDIDFSNRQIKISGAATQAFGSVNSQLLKNETGGFEFKIETLSDFAIGFNRLADEQSYSERDLEFGIDVFANGSFNLLKSDVIVHTGSLAQGDVIRMYKENYKVNLYINEIQVASTDINIDLATDYTVDVILKTPLTLLSEFILIHHAAKFKRRIKTIVGQSECEINNGYLAFDEGYSFNYPVGTITGTIDIYNDLTNDYITSVVFSGNINGTIPLPVGQYRIEYTWTNGTISQSWIEYHDIGEKLIWELQNQYFNLVPNTLNTITTNSNNASPTAIAKSTNVLEDSETGWISFYTKTKKKYSTVPINGGQAQFLSPSFATVEMKTNSGQSHLKVHTSSWGNIITRYVSIIANGAYIAPVFTATNGKSFKITLDAGVPNTWSVYHNSPTVPVVTVNQTATAEYRVYATASGGTIYDTYASFCGPVESERCGHLDYELDGNYYVAKNGRFCFVYNEEYNDLDIELNIYNNDGLLVATQSDFNLPPLIHGENRVTLDFATYDCTNEGYYVLEVINDKKEKFYLRFYFDNPNSTWPAYVAPCYAPSDF